MDADDQIERLAAVVPASVLALCQRLRGAGFEAWTVGGAVRDAILDRPIGDWDVATSAMPEQVGELFDKVLPTGIQHGTVTVVFGRGRDHEMIEVTTFRGDGDYTDARRPDNVELGVPLDEDLARRDLVINAMAYDPVDRVLHDPFGGRADLADRRIRAVGVAEDRFLEDGLRVMRAVRFAAQLEFTLDPATERAIAVALPSLAKVAVERVREELHKLLGSRQPSLGLVIARRAGIFGVVLPEVDALPAAVIDRMMMRVDGATTVPVREAALLLDAAGAGAGDAIMRRLKTSNEERKTIVRLLTHGRMWRDGELTDAELRRRMGVIGREHLAELMELWRADAAAVGAGAEVDALADRVQEIVRAGHPLTIGDLALGGTELMERVGVPAGRQVGEVLRGLLERVLVDPSLNQPAALEEAARALWAKRPDD